jgi:predicted lipid-binding transport protein (Tim44 family)
VAGGLVFWLRSILGTRHGEERDRSETVIAMSNDSAQAEASPDEALGVVSNEAQITDLLDQKDGVISISNKTAETAMLDIAAADKDFDVKFFFEAVQDVFAMVVEAFGQGDRELLEDLLAKDVYEAFETAITEREKTGEVLENEIHAINRAEIIDASLDGKQASVTIRFIADEISVTKDKDGEIIAGHPDRATEMRDIWTFSRDVKSRDPRWFVTETRGDFEGDNETLPNSH